MLVTIIIMNAKLFARIYFCELKKFASRKDLLSQINVFQKFCDHLKTCGICENFFSRKFVHLG